jgi:uncharacterized protein
MAEKDQAFVEYIAKELVETPEKVVTKRTVDEMGVLIELTVDKEDMGVIIGKEGKTAKAIRTLLRVLGAKNDARVNLKIVEPEGGEIREPKAKQAEVEGELEPAEEAPVEVEEISAIDNSIENDFVDLDEE